MRPKFCGCCLNPGQSHPISVIGTSEHPLDPCPVPVEPQEGGTSLEQALACFPPRMRLPFKVGQSCPTERTMSEQISLLVVVGGTLRVGLPIAQVRETMRPLPIESLGYPLPFVLGLSTIRGLSTPVIDLGLLLARRERPASFRRFVTIHVEDRLAALAVEEVEGVVTMNASSFSRLPPLLSQAAGDSVEGLSLADAKLFLALKPSRLVPDPWVNTQADAS